MTAIGYQEYAIFFKLTYYSQKTEGAIREYLGQLSEVVYAERTIGVWDLRIQVAASTYVAFLATLDKLRAFLGKNISTYSFAILVEELKRSTYVE